jgi:hypothetical protein
MIEDEVEDEMEPTLPVKNPANHSNGFKGNAPIQTHKPNAPTAITTKQPISPSKQADLFLKKDQSIISE